MDGSKTLLYAKVPTAIILVASAAVHIFLNDTLSSRIDSTVIYLITLAFLILVIPWERLKSFKAAGIELSLEDPSVEAALYPVGLDTIQESKLKAKLRTMMPNLATIYGSRILWIDNHPNNVTAERRCLRSFGVNITAVRSSEAAQNMLENDNDFDLLISDIGRTGDSLTAIKKKDGLKENREGVNFIIKLRQSGADYTEAIPIIFYTAYSEYMSTKFTQPIRAFRSDIEVSKTFSNLIPKVVRILAESRSKPIPLGGSKVATDSS